MNFLYLHTGGTHTILEADKKDDVSRRKNVSTINGIGHHIGNCYTNIFPRIDPEL